MSYLKRLGAIASASLSALLVAGPSAFALTYGDLDVNGFLTAGVARSNNFEQYRTTTTSNGIRDVWKTNNLTLGGLQATYHATDELEFTGQVTSKGLDKYALNLSWLFMKYQITPELSATVGRYRTPLFNFSQIVDVGYLQPWAFPPAAVYPTNDFLNNLGGLTLFYSRPLSDNWHLDMDLFFGQNNNEFYFSTNKANIKLRNVYGLGFAVSNDWIKLHAVHARGNVKINLFDQTTYNALLNSSYMIGVKGAPGPFLTTDFFSPMGTFSGLSYEIHKNNWLNLAEVTYTTVQGNVSNYYGLYMTVGYHYKDFLPSITYSRYAQVKTSAIYISVFGRNSQDTITGALRWDFREDMALKAQYDFLMPRENSKGQFLAKPRSNVSLFSVAFNYMF